MPMRAYRSKTKWETYRNHISIHMPMRAYPSMVGFLTANPLNFNTYAHAGISAKLYKKTTE